MVWGTVRVEGSCGVILGHEPTVENGTRGHVFKLLPSRADHGLTELYGATLGRGAWCSGRKKERRRWNRARVSGSPLIEKFTLDRKEGGCGGAGAFHSPVSTVCQTEKRFLDRHRTPVRSGHQIETPWRRRSKPHRQEKTLVSNQSKW